MSGLDRERIVYSIAPVGVAQAAFDVAWQYAQERSQFGMPIVGFQMVQSTLAQIATEIQAARVLSYWGRGQGRTRQARPVGSQLRQAVLRASGRPVR